MSKQFKVSVIMPIYNVAPYLRDSIECVLGQTMGFAENIQLILVNDGSTDNGLEICRSYQQAHPDNISVVDQENAGVSAARNAGLPLATGQYLTFFDPDDIWDKDAFQKAYDFLQAHAEKIDFVCCRSAFFEGKTGYHNLDARFRKGDRVINVKTTPQHFVLAATTCFIKTDVAQEHRFDQRLCYGEDSKYMVEIALRKGCYGVLKSALYRIRERKADNSLTQSYRMGRYTDTMQHYYCHLRALADGEYAEYRPYLEQCILNGVKYRITQPAHPDMTEAERAAYQETVYDLVRRTDAYEFTRTPSVGSPRKLHLMHIKYGEEALNTLEIRAGRVYSCGYDMGLLPKNTLEIRSVTLDKNHCTVKGIFRNLPDPRAGLAVLANGKEAPVQLTADSKASLASLANEPVVCGFSFCADIPLTDRQIELSFALTFKGSKAVLMPQMAKNALPQDAKKWDASFHEDGVLFLEKRPLFGSLKGRPAPATPAANAVTVPEARMGVFKKSVTAEIVAEDLGISPEEAFVKLDAVRSAYGLSHNRIAAKGLLACATAQELDARAQEVLASEQRFVDRVCEATGLTADVVRQRADAVRKAHNVSLQQWCNYGLYLMDDQAVARWAEEDRAQRQETVAMVAKKTGWTKRQVRKHMAACMIRYNVDATHYLSYRCWRLTDADLQGFATQTLSVELGKRYNQDVSVLDSKVLFNQAYADLLGRKTWVNRNTSFQEFQEFAQGVSAVFCKPESLSFGVGSRKISLEGQDLQALYEDLMAQEKLVVEEYVQQHPALAEFASSCANTLRFVNIRKNDECVPLCCFIRLGRGDAAVDNYGAGGIAAAVDMETGVVITPGVDKFGGRHVEHPVSGKRILGFQVPHWQAVKDLACRALEHVDGINYVGWDIAVREDGPVLIEGNSHSDIRTYQACWAFQKRGVKYLFSPYLED